MRSAFVGLVLLLIATGSGFGQICGPNEILVKNDNLPAVLPPTPVGASVIQGLCENEACAAVFDVSGVGQVVRVNLCGGPLISPAGVAGNVAVVNLVIYDGVQFIGGIPNLGPVAFDYTQVTGNSIQFTSSAVNTVDISAFNVDITSGKMVVAWFMVLNPNGACATGFPTNFATDNGSFQFTCSPAVTPPQRNLIFITGQGWRDAATAMVSGVQLCPFFYSGNWLIRACVEDVTPTSPLMLNFFPSASYTPGTGPLLVQFNATPANAGKLYVPVVSATLGSAPLPGTGLALPVLHDALCVAYFNDAFAHSLFQLNPAPLYASPLSASGQATGLINIPGVYTPPISIPIYISYLVVGSVIEDVSPPFTLTLTP